MADFYSQMAEVAAQLLAPTSQSGLGQGKIELTRTIKGTIDPATPWIPPVDTYETELLRGAVKGISKELVGVELGGIVLAASDREAICTVPKMAYTAGDVLSVDEIPVTVISVQKIPAAGITSAVKFIIREAKTGLLNRLG